MKSGYRVISYLSTYGVNFDIIIFTNKQNMKYKSPATGFYISCSGYVLIRVYTLTSVTIFFKLNYITTVLILHTN